MDSSLYNPFLSGSLNILNQMVGLEVKFDSEVSVGEKEIDSYGVTSIITFTGARSGRFLIDMEPVLALHIASSIIGVEFDNVKEYDVLMAISELNNIIAGDAITNLNDTYNWGLRLAPPIVLSGEEPIISVPKLTSVTIDGTTDIGKMKIDIAFVREE
ncbi:MAG: hypothetical protein GX974_07685 [Clostridiales bacterium]|nr:hypothetical protein [Clostridiales bacterium]